jgi:hypothetical protein
MKKNTHKQCRLEREGAIQVTWIPTEFATDNRVIDLKSNGEWVRGWKVTNVFQAEMDSEVIQDRARDHVSHRKATDV